MDVDANTCDILNVWESVDERWFLTRYSAFVEFRGLRLPMRRAAWNDYLGKLVTELQP